MTKNDFLEEIMEQVYDEQAYINVLTEYSTNAQDVDNDHIFRLLKHLNIINTKILDKIDREIYLTKN